ncbi:MAG TPA: hypothetical protein VJJ24_03145 [Candidatus Paceibacterota bacterium]
MSRYSFFSFDRFEIDKAQNAVRFFYSFDDELKFTHELNLDLSKVVDPKSIEAAVFALGMAEIPSYYKNYCPSKIIVRAGKLNDEQVKFWHTLYEKGLGEFFYKNNIDYRGLINIEIALDAPEINVAVGPLHDVIKMLVPVGGGKDSLVTTELLKEKGKEVTWFMLEPLSWIEKLRKVAGVKDYITVERSVEKNFGGFSKLEGAYNGHVPITAVYIFSAALAAQIYGFKYAVLSTERSAEEGNLTYLGSEINHQYSKTFEFEKAAHDYIKEYVSPELYIFSLLRNLYEVQIFEKFAKHEKYFPYFISCNKGLKTGTWCGECAKCAFVFMGLAAFLPIESVIKILGKNLFDDSSLAETFKELIGRGAQKPFDCVGTYEENMLLLWMTKQNIEKENKPIPKLFSEIDVNEGGKYQNLLTASTSDHLIPKDLI